ncbi:hypothetical protein PR002_g2905 [Phytophthora rubi]|uniref:RxLR effector protein n=1 Tax=Phytophthora rubi TaxID=129364 RepID=A0A6A3NSS7_9STRA|nr:hypothetical protein PR002_g2905 [Phytophthora rubi]
MVVGLRAVFHSIHLVSASAASSFLLPLFTSPSPSPSLCLHLLSRHVLTHSSLLSSGFSPLDQLREGFRRQLRKPTVLEGPCR